MINKLVYTRASNEVKKISTGTCITLTVLGCLWSFHLVSLSDPGSRLYPVNSKSKPQPIHMSVNSQHNAA